MSLSELLLRLKGVKGRGSRWMAKCPSHNDKNPSLSVQEREGRILLKCFAGCSYEQICKALGIDSSALQLSKTNMSGRAVRNLISIVETYDYTDEVGTLLSQVVRLEPKGFRQRKPDGKGGWLPNVENVRRVLYRLSDILANSDAMVFIVEGEKDADRLGSFGLVATTNPGGAGKWRGDYNESLRGRHVCILPDNDEAGATHAQQVANSLQTVAADVRVLALENLPAKGDVSNWLDTGGTAEELERLAWNAPTLEASIKNELHSHEIRSVLADARPKICLPGPDRLISDFAAELIAHVGDREIYLHNGEVVTVTEGDLRPLTPQALRTWCEQYIIGYRSKRVGENVWEFGVTMRDDEARCVLASPQFISGLRQVRRVNGCRLPTFDSDEVLTLLPFGYHAQSKTLTVADLEYEEVPLSLAVETIDKLLAEFCFADGDQSRAVAVSAMVGLFADQLLPSHSLRPCFVFVANAEGAGKTLLAQIITTPTVGAVSVSSKAEDEEEVRKVLTTAVREGRGVIFLDNLKGRLSSPTLEAFLSAAKWTDRKRETRRPL